MSAYSLYIEKNENLFQAQDFSRNNRVCARLAEKPYLLRKGMLLEIGGVKCFVKTVFPRTSFPKICDEFMYVDSDEASYPLKQIFLGEPHNNPKSRILAEEDNRYKSRFGLFDDEEDAKDGAGA